LASNIFWERDDQYFTPDLDTGCVEGVRRAWLIERMNQEGVPINTGFYQKEALYSANSVFNVNVAGITHIMAVNEARFTKNEWVECLFEN
jgi:branched-subunit amino acid aminotransferase/4-amino-4-deoxychorismate lyase